MPALIASLIELLVLFLLIKGSYNFIRALILRARFCRHLHATSQRFGYSLVKSRAFLASFFRAGTRPDLILCTDDAKYLICFVTCQARKRFYHFIDADRYIRSMKLFISLPMAKKADEIRLFAQLKKAPHLDAALLEQDDAKKVVPVLLFNPAPVEISYLNEQRTKSPIVGNGAQLYHWYAYDSSAFFHTLQR